jgi:hypothetical protein
MQLNQDLHIHTIFSTHDGAVAQEQTIELIAAVKHAKRIGISDHFEDLVNDFDTYYKNVKQLGFYVGTEIDGSRLVNEAIACKAEYYIFHCRNMESEYRELEKLLQTNKPVIVAHPNFMETDLNRVSPECYVEVSNRYVWRSDWRKDLSPFVKRFKFILSSDVHQPNWLNQTIAKHVANELGIQETIIFNA